METGSHVEVVREAAAVGERRRYTKQCFSTKAGDLRAWTGRESRILADLARRGVRCVPALAADAGNGPMQTLDAGASVQQLVTLLAARLAVAQFGEALKAPTEAMLARVRARGVRGAPSCN